MNQQHEEAIISLARAWHVLKKHGAIGLNTEGSRPQVHLYKMSDFDAIPGEPTVTLHENGNRKWQQYSKIAFGVTFITIKFKEDEVNA